MIKTKTKVNISFIMLLSIIAGTIAGVAAKQTVSADETTFNINVVERLSVTVEQPSKGNWASGSVNTFLRNKVSLSVTSNNATGYTATMYSKKTTDLTNNDLTDFTIPTLSSTTTRSAFPTNYWGYSLNDTESGSSSSSYSAMTTSSSPIALSSSDGPVTDDTTDIYFGTKADITKASGTYASDVVISVVGSVTDNEEPATPSSDTNTTDNYATYDSNQDYSVHTSSSSSTTTTTTTTDVISGRYTEPLGVTNSTSSTISSIATGSAITTGLAVASATAATSGLILFAFAKRRDDDDEDDE